MIWPFTSKLLDDLVDEPLSTQHAHDMADIHSATFKHAWTDGDFINLLNKKNVGGVVLRELMSKGGKHIGFVLTRVVADEAEILTIAVQPRWQNYGVGRKLLNIVMTQMRHDGVMALFLEVDERNKSAVALYKRAGFEQVAIRVNYYKTGDGARSNALVMRRDVG